MNRLFSASRSSSQFVSKAKMSINKVSHCIFDMDGLLLGKITFFRFYFMIFGADFPIKFSFFLGLFMLAIQCAFSCRTFSGFQFISLHFSYQKIVC